MQVRTQNNKFELAYTNLLSKIMTEGNVKTDRTGTGTISVFGEQLKIDLSDMALPILTARQLFPKSALVEMLWFINGGTEISYLKKYGVGIWDEWVIPGSDVWVESDKPMTDKDYYNYVRCVYPEIYSQYRTLIASNSEFNNIDHLKSMMVAHPLKKSYKLMDGSIGKGSYGDQWRNWKDIRLDVSDPDRDDEYYEMGYESESTENPENKLVMVRNVDQFKIAIETLKKNPDSRRIIISAWNAGYADQLPLPPCHSFMQFYTHLNSAGQRMLSLKITCRSQDYVLGTPSNILQYAFLAHLVAAECGMVADKLIWEGGDVHVYRNQIPGVDEFLSRQALNVQPKLVIVNKKDSIFDYTYEDFAIEGYEHGEKIVFPIAV